MRRRAEIDARPALALALLAAASCASSVGSAGTQGSPKSPDEGSTDHPSGQLARSTAILLAWRELPVGSPVHALHDASPAKDWLAHTDIQPILVQSGVWNIWGERPFSLFSLDPFPNAAAGSESIVIKVNDVHTVEQLKAAITARDEAVRIHEYDVSGVRPIAAYRTSRLRRAPFDYEVLTSPFSVALTTDGRGIVVKRPKDTQETSVRVLDVCLGERRPEMKGRILYVGQSAVGITDGDVVDRKMCHAWVSLETFAVTCQGCD